MCYKIENGLVAVKASEYMQSSSRRAINTNTLKFPTVAARCDAHAQSYSPRTIRDWNALSDSDVAPPSSNSFREGLKQ